MLELKNLETSYGQSQVLFGVDLQVNEREVVTLLGRNGMGKTTAINSIMGLVRAHSGEINFEGNQIREWPTHRVAKSGMGLVPEGRQIFPNLNVIENLIATSANRLKNKNPWTLDRVFNLFPSLQERAKNMGNQLSGGEQQMLSIGRALMTNPRLLILDEATASIDSQSEKLLQEALNRLLENRTAVIIAHRLATIRKADKIIVLQEGRIIESGNHHQLLELGGLYARLYSLNYASFDDIPEELIKKIVSE